MARLGIFDAELASLGWFDGEAFPEGWFDHDLIVMDREAVTEPEEEAQSGAIAIGASPRKSDWSSARFLFDPSRLQRSKPDQEIQKLDELAETIEAAKTSASPQTIRALIDIRRLLDAQRAAYLAPPIIVIQPSIQTEAPAKQQINPAIIQLIAEML